MSDLIRSLPAGEHHTILEKVWAEYRSAGVVSSKLVDRGDITQETVRKARNPMNIEMLFVFKEAAVLPSGMVVTVYEDLVIGQVAVFEDDKLIKVAGRGGWRGTPVIESDFYVIMHPAHFGVPRWVWVPGVLHDGSWKSKFAPSPKN